MTKLLEEAFAAVSQLSETEQDAIATLIQEKIGEKAIATTPPTHYEFSVLSQFYTFRKGEEVIQFIKKNPFLTPILLEAHRHIKNYFPDSQVFLEVVTDPEIIDYLQLFLLIATNLDPEEAMDRLDKFEQDWWLNATYEVRSLVCIDVDYQ